MRGSREHQETEARLTAIEARLSALENQRCEGRTTIPEPDQEDSNPAQDESPNTGPCPTVDGQETPIPTAQNTSDEDEAANATELPAAD